MLVALNINVSTLKSKVMIFFSSPMINAIILATLKIKLHISIQS